MASSGLFIELRSAPTRLLWWCLNIWEDTLQKEEWCSYIRTTFFFGAAGFRLFAGSGLQPEPFVNVLVQSARLNQPQDF
jgi:hypothetical protein